MHIFTRDGDPAGIKSPCGDWDGEETRPDGVNGDGDGGISSSQGLGHDINL
jgi:hypothetical protein